MKKKCVKIAPDYSIFFSVNILSYKSKGGRIRKNM